MADENIKAEDFLETPEGELDSATNNEEDLTDDLEEDSEDLSDSDELDELDELEDDSDEIEEESDDLDDSMFEDDSEEVAEQVASEPIKEPKPVEVATTTDADFPPELIPGTMAYNDNITAQAEEAVKKMFKTDEYDPFDSKHLAAFNRYSRKLDEGYEKFYTDKKQELETIRTAKNRQVEAEQKIETILNTPELVEKFDKTMDTLSFGQIKELNKKAAAGDFEGYIAIAKRVSGAKAKAEEINNRQKPRQSQEPKTEVIGGGVAELLGL